VDQLGRGATVVQYCMLQAAATITSHCLETSSGTKHISYQSSVETNNTSRFAVNVADTDLFVVRLLISVV